MSNFQGREKSLSFARSLSFLVFLSFFFFFRFYVHFCFVIFIQLKTEDEENDLELRDTNGKSDVKSDDMASEATAISENGPEILMTVVTKSDGSETSPTPANHQQVFWIQSGVNPPPPSLYTIKQLNYSQVISFVFCFSVSFISFFVFFLSFRFIFIYFFSILSIASKS